MGGKRPEREAARRSLKPFLASGIFPQFERLGADFLSRRQPMKEHVATGE